MHSSSVPCTPHPVPSHCRAWAEVDLSAITHNAQAIRELVGERVSLLAVVKANGYGHGAKEVARAALRGGATWLGVASVEEGMELRQAGLTHPILLLCAPPPDAFPSVFAFDLTPMVGDRESLCALAKTGSQLGKTATAHLEIDTGIGRAGALPEQALPLWREAQELGVRITGLATHFPDADAEDLSRTQSQYQQFLTTLHILQTAGATFDWVHSSNSPATLRLEQSFRCSGVQVFRCSGSNNPATLRLEQLQENLVRPGLLLYGITPQNCPSLLKLRPALTLKARIATIRELPKGATISYGCTHTLTRPSRVATVLIGYGDGYPRELSNRGTLLVGGKPAPILGRVCMDQTVIDVTDHPEAQVGDAVICLGGEGENAPRVEQVATLLNTTEHTLTTLLTQRLPRIYLNGAE